VAPPRPILGLKPGRVKAYSTFNLPPKYRVRLPASDGTICASLDPPLSRSCRLAAGIMSGRLTPYPFVTRGSLLWETIILFVTNILSFKDITAAKVSQAWASLHELWGITLILILSVGLAEHQGSFKEFVTRVQTLGRRSGKKFLCQYLKECVRIMICFLNHVKYSIPKGGVIVKVDRSGLPTIIPGPLRVILREYLVGSTYRGFLVLRCVLTILSFYRVLQFRNLPDLASITDAFSGISPILESGELRNVFTWFPKVSVGPLLWSISESKGPNGPRATWFAGADAIALGWNTEMFLAWLRVARYFKRWGLMGWLVLIIILVTPILPIMYLAGVAIPTVLGRLSTIKEAAGKRRIVAITDWWTQTLLRPLHKGIGAILRKIPQDGTYNQWKPIEEWVLPRLRLGAKAFSFDLSSATDRLPIDFQVQVMNLFFPGLGEAWKSLLDREWIFQRKPVRYAVGQPIGAYSSWVMLALSHHVIVQLAAARAGWTSWFPHYALLGDDIVIADEDVARHYLSIILVLGVKINLGKSIISECGLIEFAKRWASPNHGELSAFPPGLLLGAWRSRLMVPMLVLHLFNHNWLHFPSQMTDALASLRSVLRIRPKLMALMLVTLLGPSGLLKWNQSHLTVFADRWFAMVSGGLQGAAVEYVIRACHMLVMKYAAESKDRAHREMEHFINNWMNVPILQGRNPIVTGILSIPLMLASPGIYIYAQSLWKAINQGLSASLNLAGLTGMASPSEDSVKFELLKITNLASIDWKRKVDSKEQFKVMEDLMKTLAFEVQIDLQNSGTLVVQSEPDRPSQSPSELA